MLLHLRNVQLSLHPLFSKSGVLAQLVEQWTENPCVPGSIPGDTTRNPGDRKTPGFSFLGTIPSHV